MLSKAMQTNQQQSLDFSLTCCITLGKSFKHSNLKFPICKMGTIITVMCAVCAHTRVCIHLCAVCIVTCAVGMFCTSWLCLPGLGEPSGTGGQDVREDLGNQWVRAQSGGLL